MPRRASDLAAELGVSHQSVPELLRRGHRNLVRNGLSQGTEEAGEAPWGG